MNSLADTLSYQEDTVKTQQVAWDEFCQQILLPRECLDPKIMEELDQTQ